MTQSTNGAGGRPLVVGAGPTGLVAACELARHGLTPRIVDRRDRPADTARALAVTARTMEVFDLIGVIEPALAAGTPIGGATLWSNGSPMVEMAIQPRQTPYAYGLDLPEVETERILRDRLTDWGLAVEWGTELSGFEQDAGGVTAHLRGPAGEETVHATWLVGADGKESTVRQGMGVEFQGDALPELWALLEAEVDWDLPSDRWQIFMSREGTWQGYPMPAGRWRLMTGLGDVPEDVRLPDPTPEDFERYGRERGVPLRHIHDAAWSSYFRVSERLAATYRVGRAFVAGDAAHVHSPAGGQGMNTCIQDAHNLAWKLALADPARPDGRLLDSYEAERRPVAKQVLRRSGLMWKTQLTTTRSADALRRFVPPLASKLHHLTVRIGDGLAQVDLDYSSSPLVADEHARRGTFEGGQAPGHRALASGGLTGPGGNPAGVYDALRGSGHVALLFGAAGELDAVAEAARAHDVESWRILQAGTARTGAEAEEHTLRDEGGGAYRDYGVRRPAVYLVRPDGYVAYRGDEDPEAFERALGVALPARSREALAGSSAA